LENVVSWLASIGTVHILSMEIVMSDHTHVRYMIIYIPALQSSFFIKSLCNTYF